jgi:AmpD protein
VRQSLCTNFSQRPSSVDVSLLVIHNISLPPGQFGGPEIEQFFHNRLDCGQDPFFEELDGMRVSAHLLIRRDGKVVQFVPFQEMAWHAGESSYQGQAACNEFSVGIELEGADDVPYTSEQYRSLVKVTGLLMERFPSLQKENIVGHSDIAPGRKTDPGPAFDWIAYRSMLDSNLSGEISL